MSKEEAMEKYDLIPKPVIEVVAVKWGWGTATLSINGAQLEVDRAQWDAVESTFGTTQTSTQLTIFHKHRNDDVVTPSTGA